MRCLDSRQVTQGASASGKALSRHVRPVQVPDAGGPLHGDSRSGSLQRRPIGLVGRNHMQAFAIIPARGGSKGIPRKNLQPVAGRPLIAWTIDAVLDASSDIECVVSTDDDEIASVASQLGARVVRRPAELADDSAPTEPALLHALDSLSAADERIYMLLQATSPMRLPGTLDRALEAFVDLEVDSLVGVVETSPFLWRGGTGRPRPLYDPARRLRRQDLSDTDRVYHETGSLYVSTVGDLRRTGNRLSGRIGLFHMDELEGVDIDTYGDLARAGSLLFTSRSRDPQSP